MGAVSGTGALDVSFHSHILSTFDICQHIFSPSISIKVTGKKCTTIIFFNCVRAYDLFTNKMLVYGEAVQRRKILIGAFRTFDSRLITDPTYPLVSTCG